jgi:ribosomal 30S subunit maturation factor RimM
VNPESPSVGLEDWFAVGRVTRAHGLSGDLEIRLFRPTEGQSASRCEFRVRLGENQGAAALLTARNVRVVSPERRIVHFQEVQDRTEAESKIGATVWAHRADTNSGLTDSADRVVGAEVWQGDRRVGLVTRIESNGAQPILVIQGEAAYLVPFVSPLVRPAPGSLDFPPHGRIPRLEVLDLPGLLDPQPD